MHRDHLRIFYYCIIIYEQIDGVAAAFTSENVEKRRRRRTAKK